MNLATDISAEKMLGPATVRIEHSTHSHRLDSCTEIAHATDVRHSFKLRSISHLTASEVPQSAMTVLFSAVMYLH